MDEDMHEYLVSAVVHFRVTAADLSSARVIATSLFDEEIEVSDLIGAGAVATVMED